MDSLKFHTQIQKKKKTLSKESVSLMTAYLLEPLLRVSVVLAMDAHIARWKTEDLLITVFTLTSILMELKNM